MDNQKFSLILDRLLERTEEGKVEWEQTANRKIFLLVLKDDAISIEETFGDPTSDRIILGGLYIFDFRNENGEIVDSVKVSIYDSNKNPTPEFEKAKRLFQLARQQALKSDPTADRILEQLAA